MTRADQPQPGIPEREAANGRVSPTAVANAIREWLTCPCGQPYSSVSDSGTRIHNGCKGSQQ